MITLTDEQRAAIDANATLKPLFADLVANANRWLTFVDLALDKTDDRLPPDTDFADPDNPTADEINASMDRFIAGK